MIWFGSSAGVALSNQYPETRSAVAYVKSGWHVTVAYIVGFFVLLGLMGWSPSPKRSDMQKSELPTIQIVATVKELPKPPLT